MRGARRRTAEPPVHEPQPESVKNEGLSPSTPSSALRSFVLRWGRDTPDQVKGAVKEGFGALTGDRSTEAEGKGERLKGTLQEEYGKIKSDINGENSPDPSRRP